MSSGGLKSDRTAGTFSVFAKLVAFSQEMADIPFGSVEYTKHIHCAHMHTRSIIYGVTDGLSSSYQHQQPA